jgi:hypothetical protein
MHNMFQRVERVLESKKTAGKLESCLHILIANPKKPWNTYSCCSDGDLSESRRSEKRVVKAIVVLIRNTTWRCGKLERAIVRHLYSKHTVLGKPQMPISDMLLTLKLTGKKKNEFLDAVKRLERRNIIKILRFVN